MVTTIGQRIHRPPMAAVFAALMPEPAIETGCCGRRRRQGGAPEAAQHPRVGAHPRLTVGLQSVDRRRMRRALRDLQEEPGSERARSELEETVTGLSRIDTVLDAIETRRSYRVAHVAAPVFDQHGAVTAALYLLGFNQPVTGVELERLGHQLSRVGVSVTRAGGGTIPRSATFRS
jgi:hypothetical protein